MVFIARIFNKHTILSYRSGLMVRDINKSKSFKLFIILTIKSCDILMCQSKYWSQYYKDISNAPEEKFVIIKNWIDTTSFDMCNMSRKNNGQINILFMGSLSKNKGVYDLIAMIDKYRGEFNKSKLILCGGGPDYNNITNLINKLELGYIVELKGWVNDAEKISILRESDIHILPSYFEGMPNSILEAMASGKPIISTKVGAIPELVIDGKTGFLTQPGDIDSMKSLLFTLINNIDLRNTMGRNAKVFIKKNHDIDILYKDIYRIIKNNSLDDSQS